MRKAIIIMLALLVGLSAVPVTYACYTGKWNWLPQTQCCPTDDCDAVFKWAVSNDDGDIRSGVDPGDDGGGTEYDYWGADSSNDPSAPQAVGVSACRYTKDVAKTTAQVECDEHYITVVLDNTYPSYYPTVFYGIKNMGKMTATITGIEVDEDPYSIATDIPEITVTVSDIAVNQTIAPGQEIMGNLEIHIEQCALQNWTYYLQVKITTDCKQVKEKCETAYAYGGKSCKPFNKIPDLHTNKWGWVMGPLEEGNYSFDIYAGAGQNFWSKGKKVGWLEVTYDGSEATVTYHMDAGYTMKETHLYVGCDPLPKHPRTHKPTVSPGQFPYGDDSLPNVSEATYTISGFSNEAIYIIAHAVVCW